MRKQNIKEATGSGSSGRMKIPLVLAPQTWDVEQVKPFVNPVSQYVSATNAYDSYDGEMERDDQTIEKNELSAKQKADRAKALFSQSDDDGNPINGFQPMGSEVPGTPKEVKMKANIPSFNYEKVLKEDLAVWFGTKKKPKGSKQPKGPWVDICRKVDGKHPPCGRKDADTGSYPKCRAAGVAGKMSDSQKRNACQQKRKAEKNDPQKGKGQKPVMTSYKTKKESVDSIVFNILSEIRNSF